MGARAGRQGRSQPGVRASITQDGAEAVLWSSACSPTAWHSPGVPSCGAAAQSGTELEGKHRASLAVPAAHICGF